MVIFSFERIINIFNELNLNVFSFLPANDNAYVYVPYSFSYVPLIVSIVLCASIITKPLSFVNEIKKLIAIFRHSLYYIYIG